MTPVQWMLLFWGFMVGVHLGCAWHAARDWRRASKAWDEATEALERATELERRANERLLGPDNPELARAYRLISRPGPEHDA